MRNIHSISLSEENNKKFEEICEKLGHNKSSVIGDFIREKYSEICPSEMSPKERYENLHVLFVLKPIFKTRLECSEEVFEEMMENIYDGLKEAFPEFVEVIDKSIEDTKSYA